MMFAVVWDLQFTLACLAGVLYSASSQIMSLDRSVGGRTFGALIFVGTVVTGASLGGGLVMLAWLARGDAEALVGYLPDDLQEFPPLATLQRWQDAFASLTAVPLPPASQDLVDGLVADLSALLNDLLPPISVSYWALLMVLAAIAFVPAAAARSNPDFAKSSVIAIFTVFLSSMFVFGTLLPLLGVKLFWETIVIGYYKVALVAGAANALAGVVLCVRSSHDDVRRGCAAVFSGLGLHISRLGTAASGAAVSTPPHVADGEEKAIAVVDSSQPPPAAGWSDSQLQDEAVKQCAADETCYVQARIAECSKGVKLLDKPAEKATSNGGSVRRKAGARGLPPLPAQAEEATLNMVWAELELSLKTAKFEPPLPQLCSQPGADLAKYAALATQLARLQRAVMVMRRGQARCLSALSATDGTTAATAARLRTVLGRLSSLAAAACGGAAQALAHMPALAACSGAALRWRPLTADDWAAAREDLSAEAALLARSYEEEYTKGGLAFALSLGLGEHHALLYSLAAAAEVLDSAQAAEAAAADALGVPARYSVSKKGSGGANGSDAATPDPAPSFKEDLEAPMAAASPSPAAAKGAAPPPGLLKRVLANPFASNATILLLLASPAMVILLVLQACLGMARAVPGLLTSRQAWRKVLLNRSNQFAIKYWAGMTGAVLVIIAIMWKAVPDGENPLVDAKQQGDFFVVWQPIYASITIAICLQDTVEASLMRAVLRTTMTALGGTLGFLVMLNGSLANNPYWVVSWVVAFSWLCGLLSPDRSLRYSLFLTVFSFNAVIICQYIGCCAVPGDPQVYGGKVISTLIGSTVAIGVGWMILPWFGSERMLHDQARALQAALGLLRDMHAEVEAAAAADRAVSIGGWLDRVEQDVQAPLARVVKDLDMNLIDRRQMPFTWHLLPEPAVLHMVQPALSSLRDRLASAALVLGQDLFAVAGGPRQVVPGPVFRRVLPQLRGEEEGLFAALDQLVEACTANMAAGVAGSRLKPHRAAVEQAVAAAQDARVRLHRAYLQAQPAVLTAAGGHSAGDFACGAWLHAALRCTDEMVVAASMLLQDAAQDRDVLGGWVRAWRGQRVAPPV